MAKNQPKRNQKKSPGLYSKIRQMIIQKRQLDATSTKEQQKLQKQQLKQQRAAQRIVDKECDKIESKYTNKKAEVSEKIHALREHNPAEYDKAMQRIRDVDDQKHLKKGQVKSGVFWISKEEAAERKAMNDKIKSKYK